MDGIGWWSQWGCELFGTHGLRGSNMFPMKRQSEDAGASALDGAVNHGEVDNVGIQPLLLGGLEHFGTCFIFPCIGNSNTH